MPKKLKILFVASEMAPFIKTGGLADVTGVLPKVLARMGHDVVCVIPKYADLNIGERFIHATNRSLNVWMGTKEEWCSLFMVEEEGVRVYLVEHHGFFSRPLLYHDKNFKDYEDNPARFAFLSRAALETARYLKFDPDIVHVHDWQTAAVSAYLKTWHWNDSILGKAASLLTIHNASYQGVYPPTWYPYTGLRLEDFKPNAFECFGGMGLLKGGIAFADAVNTVSPGYAREISAPYSPSGLAPYLSDKGRAFTGILNGVEYELWNPETDPLIAANYARSDMSGKRKCKAELQRAFGLTENPGTLLMGIVGRFTEQKGYHLLAQCIDSVMRDMAVQFVVLGSGDPILQDFFREFARKRSGRAGARIGYSEDISHMIEAGADLFLMPSLFEPCGLNQLYSLKYGTLPLVRATGGLDDTVEQYDEKTGQGTGFKFKEVDPMALHYCIGWAVSTFYDRRDHWDAMVARAMSKEFTWEDSAKKYVDFYGVAMERKVEWDARFLASRKEGSAGYAAAESTRT
jgi:starch synthase